MKKIAPYTEINTAISSLDNGGRFYNVMTKADDGVISQAELGKVGGLFNDKQKMILFLELSMLKLNSTEKETIISKLDKNLKEVYLKYKPQNLLPSEVDEKGILSSNMILTGVPKLIDSKSDFKGFFMVPIMVGKVMTFTMIPIIDSYDVYELRDETSSESFIIAHSRDANKLPNEKIIIAGVLKELKADDNEESSSRKFLEAVYYI
jgi:hypothetical protein